MDIQNLHAMFGQAEGAGQGNPLAALLPFIVIFAIFYLLVFRPESKKRKQLEQKVAALEKGDRITTAGGLMGIVAAVKENTVSAKIADNVRVEILKSAVSNVEKRKSGQES